MALPEPWLRGSLSGLDPVISGVLYCFEQVREDVARWTGDLSDDDLWRREGDLAPVGFHIRHMAGSVERLMTYARGHQLSEEQLAALGRESQPGPGRAELTEEFESTLKGAEDTLRSLDPARLPEPRQVGRSRLPTTLGGLLVHIAEHTQRHLGEAIITAKVVRSRRVSEG
jgi:hypothetical protein